MNTRKFVKMKLKCPSCQEVTTILIHEEGASYCDSCNIEVRPPVSYQEATKSIGCPIPIEISIGQPIDLVEKASRYIRTGSDDLFEETIALLDDINMRNKQDNSLASVASWNGNIYALELLREKGANFNDPSVSVYAARNPSSLKYLIKNNLLNANAVGENGISPIQHACGLDAFGGFYFSKELAEERAGCIALLMENGANINYANHKGRTVLHSGVASGSIVIVAEILKHNPDPTIVCKEGKTPIMYALKHDDEMRKMIRDYCFGIYNIRETMS